MNEVRYLNLRPMNGSHMLMFTHPHGTVRACALLVLMVSCSKNPAFEEVRSLSFSSSDGMRVASTVYTPRLDNAPPGLILVHRYGGDRAVWEGFAHAARRHGLLVIALDLRGHGESRERNGESLHYARMSHAAIRESLHDIEAAKHQLLEAGAHPDHLAVMGEGLGANLALHFALKDPDIQAVVMVSPGLEHQGIGTENEIRQLTDCPTLLISGEGDAYAAMSASALKAAAPIFSELRTWPGGAHGADLLATHPQAVPYILQWLLGILHDDKAP